MSTKVIIKKNLVIFRKRGDWTAIYSQILKDYGMGMAVRTRLKRELGFTYRYHTEWVESTQTKNGRPTRYCEEQVCVDFYNESAQSWFLLRYVNVS